MRLLGMMAGLAAAIVVRAPAAHADEPACVVTYAVDAARDVTVSGARCDTPELEPMALAFALTRVEGPFRELLLMQAPVEVEFAFSEAVIRQYSSQHSDAHHQNQEGI